MLGREIVLCSALRTEDHNHRESYKNMSEFVRICAKAALPPSGEAREIALGEKTLCVANDNGAISAMDNVCPHRGGPLGQGMIELGKVVCPWHGWVWDPKTGAADQNPSVKVAVYPLKIENGDVLIEI